MAEKKRLRGDRDYSDSEYTVSEDEERPRKNGMFRCVFIYLLSYPWFS